jgi:PEGA domain-containing protein
MQQPPPGYPPMQQPPQRGPAGRRMPPPPPQQGPDPRGGPASGYGTLAVRVQPNDAEVSIDGEPWRGPAGQDRLNVEVAEGSHTVEIRKAGFRTYITQVEVRRGETTPLNVSLRGEQ